MKNRFLAIHSRIILGFQERGANTRPSWLNLRLCCLQLAGGMAWVAASSLLVQPATAQEGLKIKDVKYWTNLCELQAQAGQFDEALKACEEALSLRRGRRNPNLWATYSGVQIKAKKYPDAIASASQALKRNKRSSVALTYQCIAHRELKQEDIALERCNEALKMNGDWGQLSPTVAWRYRGLILNQDQQYEQALIAFDRTLLLEPNESLTRLYQCEALAQLSRYDESILACQAALNGDGNWGPENPGLAWYYQGVAHRELGNEMQRIGNELQAFEDYEAAIADYDEAIALDPANHNTWTDQGWVFNTLERHTEALTSYNQAVALKEDHSRALVGQCRALNRLKQYEPAAAACEAALQGDRLWWSLGAAEAWNQLSHGLAGQGKFEEALAAANRAVGIKEDYAVAWSDRAVVLWFLERYPEALASVEQALTLNDQDPKFWANKGRIARSQGSYQVAQTAYTQSLVLEPEDAEVWANQSVVFWFLNQPDAALAAANRALVIDPELAIAWQNRGVALAMLGLYLDARHAYEQVIELDEKNASAWAGKGVVLSQLQQYDEAIAALQQAVALDPNQAVAQEALLRLNEWKQQLEASQQ